MALQWKAKPPGTASRVRFNLLADSVPLPSRGPFTGLTVEGVEGLAIDDIWGVGYLKTPIVDEKSSRDIPFSIATFIDEIFEVRPPLAGWQNAGYDEVGWKPAVLPHSRGGERHAGEDLYLRTSVKIGAFQRAALIVEAIDPAGEIWINGEVVAAIHDRYPFAIDVSRYLLPSRENLIAVRVRPITRAS